MKIFEWTQRFLRVGIAIMPLYHRSKVPMLASWEHLNHELNTEYQLEQWFPTDWCNYAVICGWQNLVVLDFDTFEWFDLWKLYMVANGMTGVFEKSFKVITSHGVHVYLRTIERAVNEKRIARSGGIDVQAQSKYVVGPGCVHPSGTQYVPVGELRLIEVESVESVLPAAYFPHVTADRVEFHRRAVEFQYIDTEYRLDPLTDTRDLISKVKSSVRIENLFTGVQRSSTNGQWLKARCLFHDDKHQSAWIDTVRQLAGCQVCGMKPMDVLNVYARMHNISDRDAVTRLAEEVGIWR
jgi:hypothetical protein